MYDMLCTFDVACNLCITLNRKKLSQRANILYLTLNDVDCSKTMNILLLTLYISKH